MTSPEDIPLRIDRLAAEMIDGDDESARQALEQLLLDHPDMQSYYADVIETYLLVRNELRHQGYMPEFSMVGGPPPELAEASFSCTRLAEHIERDVRIGHRGIWLGVALSLAVAIGVMVFLAQRPNSRQTVDIQGAQSDSAAEVGQTLISQDGQIVLRDPELLGAVSRLTRTSRLSGVRLPIHAASRTASPVPITGLALLDRNPTRPDRGYLLALEPGWRMDVFVDAEAGGRNVLSMVEFDGEGELVGSWQSLHNTIDQGQTVRRRAGMLGSFSELNKGVRPRYFLLAGSHMLSGQRSDETWYQSDCKIQFDSQQLKVIGWDDSGSSSTDERKFRDYVPDYDYNDISAIVRFIPPEPLESSSGVSIHPPPMAESLSAEELGTGIVLDVKPTETMLLVISSDAVLQNSIQLVEHPSRKVVWRHEGTPTDFVTGQPGERGVLVIQNDSDVAVRFELQGHHRPGNRYQMARRWTNSPWAVLGEGARHLTVGFEDSPLERSQHDWNDILAVVHWFDE